MVCNQTISLALFFHSLSKPPKIKLTRKFSTPFHGFNLSTIFFFLMLCYYFVKNPFRWIVTVYTSLACMKDIK